MKTKGRNILLRLCYSVVTQLLRRTCFHSWFSDGCGYCKPIKKKNRWRRTKLVSMVVFVHKSCLFDFFLFRFFKSYREIDTVQCKNPFIVTEKYVRGDLRGV